MAWGDEGSLSCPPLCFPASSQVVPFPASLTWPLEEEFECLLEACVELTALYNPRPLDLPSKGKSRF